MIARVPELAGPTFDYSIDELVTVSVRTYYQAGKTFAILDTEWLSDGKEGAGKHSHTLDPYQLREWQILIALLAIDRPGIDWARILEGAKTVLAPALPSLSSKTIDKFRLLSVEDIDTLPDPQWLLEGVMPLGGLAVLYGPSGSGKTFVALDMALSIAGRQSWLGHDTMPGPVVYAAAEGRGGLKGRIRAWRDSRPDCDLSGFHLLPQAVNMLDEQEVTALLGVLLEVGDPALVVVDTLARSMVGGDENAARDMGLFIASCDRIREATQGTVLVIHHTGKNGDAERGSSALRGACDTMIAQSAEDAVIKLTCDKQKDAEPFAPIYATRVTAGDSCFVAPMAVSAIDGMTANARKVLRELTDTFTDTGATPKQLQNATKLEERTVYRALKTLTERKLTQREGKGKYKAVAKND